MIKDHDGDHKIVENLKLNFPTIVYDNLLPIVRSGIVSTGSSTEIALLVGEGEVGQRWWDTMRRVSGRPVAGLVAYNVTALEVGLMESIHFRKGCYVGQEVLGKTVSMTNAIRRRLCSIMISADSLSRGLVKAGDLIVDAEGDTVGLVPSTTSVYTIQLENLQYVQHVRFMGSTYLGVLASEAGVREDLLPASFMSSLNQYLRSTYLVLLKSSFVSDSVLNEPTDLFIQTTPGNIHMYMYIYILICMCIYTHVYVYTNMDAHI
jgi:folate-binding protein YgfZ